jgi:hypothetical protein
MSMHSSVLLSASGTSPDCIWLHPSVCDCGGCRKADRVAVSAFPHGVLGTSSYFVILLSRYATEIIWRLLTYCCASTVTAIAYYVFHYERHFTSREALLCGFVASANTLGMSLLTRIAAPSWMVIFPILYCFTMCSSPFLASPGEQQKW